MILHLFLLNLNSMTLAAFFFLLASMAETISTFVTSNEDVEAGVSSSGSTLDFLVGGGLDDFFPLEPLALFIFNYKTCNVNYVIRQ